MYISPTLPAAGGLWPIQAPPQAQALASMHIGSGPGVSGLSAMQVKPLWPSRSVRGVPSACIVTMVASEDTLAGAAFIALSISFWSSAAVGLAAGVAPAAGRAY